MLSEASFYLTGEVQSFSGAATVTLDGTPVNLQGGQSEGGYFQELVSFDNEASQREVIVRVSDADGRTTERSVSYSRDITPPQITVGGGIQPVPAENAVSDYPYILTGTVVDDNISSFSVNGQSVGLEPDGNPGSYRFAVNIPLGAGEPTAVSLSARDYAGNTHSVEYALRLAANITLEMLMPVANTTLISTGETISQQAAARVNGPIDGLMATAQVLNESGSEVDSSDLALGSGLASGYVTIPAAVGEYTVRIALHDASGLVSRTSRNITVQAPSSIALQLDRIEPADGATGIEPNTFISFFFNRAVDTSQLTIDVAETAHGYTYDRATESGNAGFASRGYELTRVDRDHENIGGSFSTLPGDKLVAFYPEREFAYNAQLFVTVSYAGEELLRTQFKTRPLPTFIEGGVRDQLGQPVPGLSVQLPALGRRTTTNRDGAFSFGYGDSAERTIPGGRYALIVNDELANPAYGSLTKEVTVEGGRNNSAGNMTVPVLNSEDAFTPLEGGKQAVMGQGDLILDLSDSKLVFADGSDRGLAMAQFTLLSQIGARSDSHFVAPWYLAIQPAGIAVDGDLSLSINPPSLNGANEYLPEEGSLVLLLGRDADSDTLLPVGVGAIANGQIVSRRAEYKNLDYFGYFPIREEHQSILQHYLDGQLQLLQMISQLRQTIESWQQAQTDTENTESTESVN